MTPLLIEPTDVLFFRDAIPMSAGQGKGAGCRLPFPTTVHEAFRASLLRTSSEAPVGKQVEGRPRGAPRKGNWHDADHEGRTTIATRSFRSLRTIGPLPWHSDHGLLLPVPLDVARQGEGAVCLQLGRDPSVAASKVPETLDRYRPPCLPFAVTPPDKKRQLHGWWTTEQFAAYLRGPAGTATTDLKPVPTEDLWQAEHRIGVAIDPGSFASREGLLYAGSYLRADHRTRFAVWAGIADASQAQAAEAEARRREAGQLARLEWLLLGGESRLARLWHSDRDGHALPNSIAAWETAPAPPPNDGPCLLKWVLVTPAIFAHGSLPGWCADTKSDRPGGRWPVGRVCLDLPGHAVLVSWCLGKPRTVSGWDIVEEKAKPTQLAVPEGGVYYFLAENRAAAAELARQLHWRPRSDFYGEKGCGYGLVSFAVQTHPMFPDVRALASALLPI